MSCSARGIGKGNICHLVAPGSTSSTMTLRLTPTQFITNLSMRIPLSDSPGVRSCTNAYSRAAVACILKITSPSLTRNLRNIEDCSYHLKNGGDVQLLFIKRTHRNGDRWSGDTAFPGGYLNVGESDLDGVTREVSEELDIDLDDSGKYAWLGRLRHVNFGDKTKFLHPHVFLYLGHTHPVLSPKPSEVAGAQWISLHTLLQHNSDSLGSRHATLEESFLQVAGWRGTWSKIAMSIAHVLGCSRVHFPCIYLPVSPTTTWSQYPDGSAGNLSYNGSAQWVLWGMSLRFVSDLLQAGNEAGAPYLQAKLPFWVDNKLFNAYLSFWHHRMEYSGSHTVSGSVLLSLSLAGTLGTYAAAVMGAVCMGEHVYLTVTA